MKQYLNHDGNDGWPCLQESEKIGKKEYEEAKTEEEKARSGSIFVTGNENILADRELLEKEFPHVKIRTLAEATEMMKALPIDHIKMRMLDTVRAQLKKGGLNDREIDEGFHNLEYQWRMGR